MSCLFLVEFSLFRPEHKYSFVHFLFCSSVFLLYYDSWSHYFLANDVPLYVDRLRIDAWFAWCPNGNQKKKREGKKVLIRERQGTTMRKWCMKEMTLTFRWWSSLAVCGMMIKKEKKGSTGLVMQPGFSKERTGKFTHRLTGPFFFFAVFLDFMPHSINVCLKTITKEKYLLETERTWPLVLPLILLTLYHSSFVFRCGSSPFLLLCVK